MTENNWQASITNHPLWMNQVLFLKPAPSGAIGKVNLFEAPNGFVAVLNWLAKTWGMPQSCFLQVHKELVKYNEVLVERGFATYSDDKIVMTDDAAFLYFARHLLDGEQTLIERVNLCVSNLFALEKDAYAVMRYMNIASPFGILKKFNSLVSNFEFTYLTEGDSRHYEIYSDRCLTFEMSDRFEVTYFHGWDDTPMIKFEQAGDDLSLDEFAAITGRFHNNIAPLLAQVFIDLQKIKPLFEADALAFVKNFCAAKIAQLQVEG